MIYFKLHKTQSCVTHAELICLFNTCVISHFAKSGDRCRDSAKLTQRGNLNGCNKRTCRVLPLKVVSQQFPMPTACWDKDFFREHPRDGGTLILSLYDLNVRILGRNIKWAIKM